MKTSIMLRKGRFKHRLLDEDFLKHKAQQAHFSLRPFIDLWKKQEITEVEMAAIYIFVFSFLRRPSDFLGGPHGSDFLTSSPVKAISAKTVVDIFRQTLDDPTCSKKLTSPSSQALSNQKSLSKFVNEVGFVEFFCAHSWRSIPVAAARALSQWQNKKYALKLMTDIPSPRQVLNMQAEGWRCVSILIEPDEIENFVLEGRDVLGFILHDLIHADHFFADDENAKAQVLFSQKIKQVLHLPRIQNMLDEDARFLSEFNYLMSDMNSVPLHLLKSFKTTLLGYFKRREGIDLRLSLPVAAEKEFTIFFLDCLAPWGFTEPALHAAQRLNTKDYQAPEDSLLLDQELRQKRN